MQLRDADALFDAIKAGGQTERGIARAAGLSHSTVNHLVTGRRVGCSLKTARAIAGALGVEVDVLFFADVDADREALTSLLGEGPSPKVVGSGASGRSTSCEVESPG